MAKQTYNADLDLAGNQLLNPVIQNLSTAPSSPKVGQIYYNTAQNTTYQWTGSLWNDLGAQYTHPNQAAINVTNTGATVLNGISVNTSGHVTATTSTTLTPAIIGAPSTTGTGASGSWGINVTGSAATLSTARTIWGQSFNGSANVTGAMTGITTATGSGIADFLGFYGTSLDTAAAPSYSFTGDSNTGMFSGAADTLGFSTGGVVRFTINTTAITSTLPITATVFNGAGTGLSGTATSLSIGGNSGSATKLQTARTLWGVSFDGSANISGNMTGVGSLTMSGLLSGMSDIRIPVAKGTVGAGSLWVGDGATAGAGGAVGNGLLSGLSDVTIAVPTTGQALVYNGSTWANQLVTSVNDSVTNYTQTWSSQKISDTVADINSTLVGGVVNKGPYNASTNVPNLDAASPVSVKNGWAYVVTAAGNFFSEPVSVGDYIIANKDNATLLSDYTIINKNIPDIVQASTGSQGIVQLATGAEVITGTDANKAITPATLMARVASDTMSGIIEVATQAEVTAGTDYSRAVTPLTMKTYITGYVGGYSATFGNGSLTSFDFAHGLNTIDCDIRIIEVATGETVIMQTRSTSATSINVQCNVAPTANQYKIIIKK